MRAVSLPRFPSAPWSSLILVVAVSAILLSVLLAVALALSGSVLDPTPDGTFLGPFRWTHTTQSTV